MSGRLARNALMPRHPMPGCLRFQDRRSVIASEGQGDPDMADITVRSMRFSFEGLDLDRPDAELAQMMPLQFELLSV